MIKLGDAAIKLELVLIYLNFYLSLADQVLDGVDKKEANFVKS